MGLRSGKAKPIDTVKRVTGDTTVRKVTIHDERTKDRVNVMETCDEMDEEDKWGVEIIEIEEASESEGELSVSYKSDEGQSR